jgi:hypothetical protein
VTRHQHEAAVAGATGESLRTVRSLGFGLLPRREEAPLDLALAVDCPFCGRPAAYPGLASGGEPALAECARCDVYFDFDPADVYATAAAGAQAVA